MITYGISALVVLALVVVGVLVYRRHQESAEKLIAKGEALIEKGKAKLEDMKK